MAELELKPSSQVCSRHFPEGDTKKVPSMSLGKNNILLCWWTLSLSCVTSYLLLNKYI